MNKKRNIPALIALFTVAGAWNLAGASPVAEQLAYLKGSYSARTQFFGDPVAVDGNSVVVGVHRDNWAGVGINPEVDGRHFLAGSGAVYVFVGAGQYWLQQAYIKASNSDAGDYFGFSVSISGDTMVVGAPFEESDAVGVNGDQNNNLRNGSGAVYVYVRDGTNWMQEAYIKASNAGVGDRFGSAVAIDGDTLVVAAGKEASGSTGVNGDQNDDSQIRAGAVYVFQKVGTNWTQLAYLKASNTQSYDEFGHSLDISGDVLVVGAPGEDSGATGVNGDQADNSQDVAGAAYVFERNGFTWGQTAYLKASNTDRSDKFGESVAVSDGTIVVGAPVEDGIQARSGAAYVFTKEAGMWVQQGYLKALHPGDQDAFGQRVDMSGEAILIGAPGEESNATGLNGDQLNNGANDAGAAYLFARGGTNWSQQAYLKASNTDAGDYFGVSVAIAGTRVAIGASWEDSIATNILGDQINNDQLNTGAVYAWSVATFRPPEITVQPTPQTLDPGEVVLLSVDVPDTDGPRYQWRKDGVPLTNDTRISGAHGPELRITNAAPADAGAYVCVVSNDFGFVTTTSVTVSINQAPLISMQPVSQIVAAGNTTTFVGGIEGSPAPSISWQHSLDGGSNWITLTDGGSVTGASSSMLTLGQVSFQRNGDYYRLTASNSLGGVISREVILSVIQTSTNLPGEPDNTFGNLGSTAVGGVFQGWDLAIQSDGKIVAAGTTNVFGSPRFFVMRFLPSGVPDVEFGTRGKVILQVGVDSGRAYAAALQTDGRILVAGKAYDGSQSDVALVRLTPSGDLDATFGTQGKAIIPIGSGNDDCRDVLVQPDGKIVCVGWTQNPSGQDIAVIRFNSDGSLDPGFGSGGKAVVSITPGDDFAFAAELTADGKIVVAGYVHDVAERDIMVARLTSTGALDTSFGSGGWVVRDLQGRHDLIFGSALQEDGKILAAGWTLGATGYQLFVARLLANGLFDATLGNDGWITAVRGTQSFANDIVVADDDGILVAGAHHGTNGHDIATVRFTAKGELDPHFGQNGWQITTFGPGHDRGRSIALQSDGKPVVVGESDSEGFVLLRYGATPPKAVVERNAGGDIELRLSRANAPGWRVQQRLRLDSGAWGELTGTITNSVGWRIENDQLTGESSRFFRAVRD